MIKETTRKGMLGKNRCDSAQWKRGKREGCGEGGADLRGKRDA
jgi:hypothetical protein